MTLSLLSLDVMSYSW